MAKQKVGDKPSIIERLFRRGGKVVAKVAEKVAKKIAPAKAPPLKVDRRHKFDEADWVYDGRWARVMSSNVYAIKYEFEDKELYVQFLGGGKRGRPRSGPGAVYVYFGVPTRAARDMFIAASIGKYVWRRLRDRYTYAKISG